MGKARTDKHGQGFYTRGFTTFLIAMTFLVVFVTGLALYFSPKGRVAHWTGWSLLGLGKEAWSGVHMVATLVFTLTAGLHIFFNWKVLLNYIRTKRTTGFRLKKEFASALAIVVAATAGTVYGIPPFSTVIDWNEGIKAYWEAKSGGPAIAHAEELTLSDFAARVGLSTPDAVARLRAAGLAIEGDQTRLKEAASQNGMTPQGIGDLLGQPTGAFSEGSGSGFGMMTLEQFCVSQGIGLQHVLDKMGSRGRSADGSMTLRELAADIGITPHELQSRIRQVTP